MTQSTSRRYFRQYGEIRAGVADLKLFLVIRTDDDVRAATEGFTPIDDSMTDEDVKRAYGVTTIYVVHDRLQIN